MEQGHFFKIRRTSDEVKSNDNTIIGTDKIYPILQNIRIDLIVESLPHYARFECKDGNSTFSIHQVEQLPKGDGIWIYFECDKLDEVVNELSKKGFEFGEMPNDKSWLWREARLKDPDNNQLILYYAGINRLNPPWRIK